MLRDAVRSILAGAAALFGALLATQHQPTTRARADWATMRAREERAARLCVYGSELAELAVQRMRDTQPGCNWRQFLTLRCPAVWSAPGEGSLRAALTTFPLSMSVAAANEELHQEPRIEADRVVVWIGRGQRPA